MTSNPQRITVLCTCPPMLAQMPSHPNVDWLIPPPFKQCVEEEYLLSKVASADVWVAGDEPVTRKILEVGSQNGGRLRHLIRWGIGVNNVDQQATKDFGLSFCNTPGVFNDEVADVAIGYVVIALRSLVQIHELNRLGNWHKPSGRSLKSCKICIIGYGNIGKAVGVRARACGMKVLPVDPYYKSGEGAPEPSYEMNDAIQDADVICLSCAATADNHGFVNSAFFEKVKHGAHIINVARGTLINETDLLSALETGRIASACLDVFEEEPLMKKEIQNHPKIVLGSHNGSNSVDAVQKVNQIVLEKCLELTQGK